MYYLSSDPTYPLVALGLAALGCLAAVRLTQQGRYLYWAGGLLLLAAAVFGIERSWVTDAERIEAVVYDLARAVEASDADRIESHIDPDATLSLRSKTTEMMPVRDLLGQFRSIKFDFIRISQLDAEAGARTRRGSAEFKATASGTFVQGMGDLNFGAVGTEWSLGFREAGPGVWKVNRITAIRLPGAAGAVLRRGGR